MSVVSRLSRIRGGRLQLTTEITSTFLDMVDFVRGILGNIESTGLEGEGDCDGLTQRITLLHEKSRDPVVFTSKPDAYPSPAAIPAPPLTAEIEESDKPIGQLSVEMAGVAPAAVEAALRTQRQGDEREIGQILVDQGTVCPSAVRAVAGYQVKVRAQCVSDTSVRVEVALLDHLMNLVGELVPVRNQILQSSNCEHATSVVHAVRRLDQITTELHSLAIKTRMQPIGTLWNRLPRIVRDLASVCDKKIRVEMEGKETELDKAIIEAIKDPLTHVVRNAVDHGIESPQQRQEAGKLPEGCIYLRAHQEGGEVNIEISDDGAGIRLELVKQRALSLGLITVNQAGSMTDSEITSLVFLPGLSTAETVTKVSGRGVGMDVLKTNIEKIGGAVDLQTRVGEGTTIRIKIPVTPAIIPAPIVSSDWVGPHR